MQLFADTYLTKKKEIEQKQQASPDKKMLAAREIYLTLHQKREKSLILRTFASARICTIIFIYKDVVGPIRESVLSVLNVVCFMGKKMWMPKVSLGFCLFFLEKRKKKLWKIEFFCLFTLSSPKCQCMVICKAVENFVISSVCLNDRMYFTHV